MRSSAPVVLILASCSTTFQVSRDQVLRLEELDRGDRVVIEDVRGDAVRVAKYSVVEVTRSNGAVVRARAGAVVVTSTVPANALLLIGGAAVRPSEPALYRVTVDDEATTRGAVIALLVTGAMLPLAVFVGLRAVEVLAGL